MYNRRFGIASLGLTLFVVSAIGWAMINHEDRPPFSLDQAKLNSFISVITDEARMKSNKKVSDMLNDSLHYSFTFSDETTAPGEYPASGDLRAIYVEYNKGPETPVHLAKSLRIKVVPRYEGEIITFHDTDADGVLDYVVVGERKSRGDTVSVTTGSPVKVDLSDVDKNKQYYYQFRYQQIFERLNNKLAL